MRPYKRSVERRVNTRLYTVEVLNYTARCRTFHDANTVATALQDAAHRHGYTTWSGTPGYPVARISSPKDENHRKVQPTIYGDADLCEFVTGLTDDGDQLDMLADAMDSWNEGMSALDEYIAATDRPDTEWTPEDLAAAFGPDYGQLGVH